MKLNLLLAILSVSLCAAQAQVTPTDPASQPLPWPSPGGAVPDSLTWPVTARDWNTITREFSERVTNALTGEVTVTPHGVIQVGTGLNYVDASGAWLPSQDLIELTADGGAAALHGPYKVSWSAAGLNSDTALTITTASNRLFQARVLGVFYFDPATGQSKLLAAPSDAAVGELLPPNQIVYRSAFNSDLLKADLRYTYTKSGFESDVILTAQPKLSPADCGFDPTTALLQVRHQWMAPVREIKTIALGTAAGPELTDDILDFGDLWFPTGRAFLTDGSSGAGTNVAARVTLPKPGRAGADVPVGKRWQSGGATSTLIESVTWTSIAPLLAALPLTASTDSPSPGAEPAAAPGQGLFAQTVLSAERGIQLAGAPYQASGLTLDYITVPATGTDWTFQPYVRGTSNTYLIDGGSAYFSGTLTFQPGCVVKYGEGAYLLTYGGLVCNGNQASPSILTSKYDLLYGDWISTLLNPYMGDVGTGLWLYYIGTNVTVSGMGVRYATTAIEFNANSSSLTETVANCALYSCQTGVEDSYNCPNVSIVNSASYQVATPTSSMCSGNPFTGSFSQGSPPTFTASPSAQFSLPGGSATFSAAATSPWGVVYLWYPGATWDSWYNQPPAYMLWGPSSVTITGSQVPSTYGAYDFAVMAINPFGATGETTQLAVADSLALGLWSNFQRSTNGLKPDIWATRDANTPPQYVTWDKSGLLYGRTGFTAISPRNSWDAEPGGTTGDLPVTALTRRHGHIRGHDAGENYPYDGENTAAEGKYVWFCDATNGLVQMHIKYAYTRWDTVGNDYTILFFDQDLPSNIATLDVVAAPASFAVELRTYSVDNVISANYLPFDICFGEIGFPPYNQFCTYATGASGSPNMLPMTDGKLAVVGFTSGSGPNVHPMQDDMDTMTTRANLSPANYQMTWHSYP